MRGPATSRSLLAGAATLAAARYAVAALGWLGTLVVVHALTPERFGAFTTAFAVLGIIGLLSELRLGRLVLADLQRAGAGEASRIAGAYVALRLVVGLAGWLVAVAVTLAAGWGPDVRGAVLVAGSVLAISSVWYGLVVVCQARHWHRTVALSQVSAQAAQLALTVTVAVAGATTVAWFALPAVVHAVVALSVVGVTVRRAHGVSLTWDARAWVRWLRDALPLSAGVALETLYTRVDVLMLSVLGTFGAVGAYGVAYKFSDLAGAVPVAVLGPAMALLVGASADEERFHRTVRSAVVLLALAGAGLAATFAVLAPDVVPALFGDRYAPAAGAARWLVGGAALHFLTAAAIAVVAARGPRRAYPAIALGGLALDVGLNAALIPRWSYDGAAVATVVTEVAVLAGLGAVAWRVPGVRPLPAADLLRTGVAAAALCGVLAALHGALPWPLLAAAAPVVYLALVRLVHVGGPGGLRAVVRDARVDDPPPATPATEAAGGDGAGRRDGRVLAIAPGAEVAGAERVLLRLLGGFAAAGRPVRLACPPGPLADLAREGGIEVVTVPDVRFPPGRGVVRLVRFAGRSLRLARALRRVAAQGGAVLVNGPHALPAVRLARLGRQRPVVLLVHDVVLRRDRRLLVRAGAPALVRAIAVSEAAAAPVRALGVDTVVVHNGTPWPVEAAAPSRGTHVVGCLATITPWKGQDVLLDAVASLDRTDVVVELAGAPLPGDRAYLARLADRAARPDLAGRVRFLGEVADPLAALRRFTVAVCPSREPEAFGLAVAEAMSVGTPVIASDHGGVRELLDGAGVLVPPDDPGALATALARLLDDSGARAAYGRAGRAAIAARFSVDRQVRAVAAVLDEVLDGMGEEAAEAAGEDSGEEVRHRGAVEVLDGRRRPKPDVVFVVPDYHPAVGGTTTHVANLARGVARLGVSPAVLTLRRRGARARRALVDGVPVARVGPASRSRLAMKVSVASVWWHLLVHRPRAVHVIMYPDFAVAARASGHRVRTTMTWAGLGDATDTLGGRGPRALLGAIRRRALAPLTHVALTPALAAELADLGLGTAVVPTPVDLDRFRPPEPATRAARRDALGLAERALVVVVVGHLRRSKRVERVIEAVALLADQGIDAHLLVVGDSRPELGDGSPAIASALEGAGLEGRVRFTGSVADVRPYLHAADVFVSASAREGLSNALLEAMACGLACVVPADAGGDQVLADGVTGLVPESADPAALAASLGALTDPRRRARLGAAAAGAAAAYGLEGVARHYWPPRGSGPARAAVPPMRSRPPAAGASDRACSVPAPVER